MKLEEFMPEPYRSLWKDPTDTMRMSYREVALEAARAAFKMATEMCERRAALCDRTREELSTTLSTAYLHRAHEMREWTETFRRMAKELE